MENEVITEFPTPETHRKYSFRHRKHTGNIVSDPVITLELSFRSKQRLPADSLYYTILSYSII